MMEIKDLLKGQKVRFSENGTEPIQTAIVFRIVHLDEYPFTYIITKSGCNIFDYEFKGIC